MTDLLAGYEGFGKPAQTGPYNKRADFGQDLLQGIDIDDAIAKINAQESVSTPTSQGFFGGLKEKWDKGFDPSGLVDDIRESEDIPRPDLGELLSEGGKALEGTVGTGIELGAGLAGWPVGAVAGTGALAGEVLKGSSSEEAAAAFDRNMEKYSGIVSEGIKDVGYGAFPTTRPERNIYTRAGSELAGEGIDLALSGARKLTNVEKGFYGDYLKSIEEIDPASGKIFGLVTELAMFKAAHIGAKKGKSIYNRKFRKELKIAKESGNPTEALKEMVDKEVTPEMEQLLLEYHPELHKQVVSQRTVSETGRRPIRMEGPEAPQRLLEAPERTLQPGEKVEIAREAGFDPREAKAVEEITDANLRMEETLANSRGKGTSPEQQIKPVEGKKPVNEMSREELIDEGLKLEDRIEEATVAGNLEGATRLSQRSNDINGALNRLQLPENKPKGGSNKYRGLRERAGKELGSEIRYDHSVRQPDGSMSHGFSFTSGVGEGGSFTVLKQKGKGRVTKGDILEAGRKILDQRKSAEGVEPGQYTKSIVEEIKKVEEKVATEVPKEVKTDGDPYNLITALKDKDGNIYYGKPQEAHFELRDRVGIRPEDVIEDGFSNYSGKWIKTEEALKIAEADRMGTLPRKKIATERELAETTDVIRGEAERVAAEETINKGRATLEEAVEEIKPLVDKATEFIETGRGDPVALSREINKAYEISNDAKFGEGLEKITEAVNAKRNSMEATAPMAPARVAGTPDINTRRGARRVQNELDGIMKDVKESGAVVDANIRSGLKMPDGTPIKPYLDLYSIRKGFKGKGKRELFKSLDKIFELSAKHDMDIHAPVVNLEVVKAMKELGAEKDLGLKTAGEVGLYRLSAEKVREIVDAGGIFEFRKQQKNINRVSPEQLADRLQLLKERNEMFKGKTEDRIKASKKLEKEISKSSSEAEIEKLTREQEADQALTNSEEYYEGRRYEEAVYREGEMNEWNNETVDYGITDAARDVFELMEDPFGNQRGSFMGDLSAKKIAAIHRLWKKAEAEGKKIGEYLKAAMPELTDPDLKKVEEFIDKHFVKGEDLIVPGKADYLKKPSQRKWGKGTPDEKIINREGYPREWYDNWQDMPEIKLPKSTGGKYFTTPRALFEDIPWLRDELYRPWRHSQKIIKMRKRQMRDHFLNPLKKMVKDKKSRRKIRDHSVLQQLYQKDANGEIVMENGSPKFVKGAKELMKENNIDVIPKLNETEIHVYDQLRKGFDVLYNEINQMRADNGLTPFKRVQDYYPFLRAVSAMKKVGLEKELHMNRTPEKMMEDFARIKEGPFMFRRSRPKHQKYKLANEPFDIFDTYASMAYDHIHTSPIVAKSRRIMSTVERPIQKMTQRGIGRTTFDPLQSSDFKNREVARYVNEWTHKISGVPMKHEMPPNVRRVVNKLNSNLSAAILGFSYRAIFVQPLALVGTFSNLGGTYTLKGIYDLPNPTKYRNAKRKSDVLATRSPEVTIAEDLGKIGDMKISEFPRVARNLSFRGLQILDNLTAHITWNGAYAQARAGKVPGGRGEKMTVEKAARYADDAVIRTQGSGAVGEIAPIQYTALGKSATMFQTFVINNWNYLAKDALGFGPNVKIKEALPKIMRYVVAVSAANFVFEDLGGMKSPMGRPVKAVMDGLDNDSNAFEILADSLAELAEPVPLVSGARYGSHLFGPLVQRVGDITVGGKYGMTPKKEISMAIDKGRFPDKTVQLAGEALGVPGTGQAIRMYRGAKRGESPYGIVAGTYTEPSKRGSSRTKRKKRSSSR